MFSIHVVPFGTERYEQTKACRNTVLRVPIGLHLNEKDTQGEERQIHIAAVDDRNHVAGTIIIKPLSETRAKFRQMAVMDHAQGRGLGRQLVTFAETLARQKGFQEAELHARITAQGFYEKLGYKIEGEPFTEVGLPTILMKKQL